MNTYYHHHHQTPIIHDHQPYNYVYSFPVAMVQDDWNYDNWWSTETLSYTPVVEYVDESIILSTHPFVTIDQQQPVYSYIPIQPQNTFLDPYGGLGPLLFPNLRPFPYTPLDAYLENRLIRIERGETLVSEESIHTGSGLSEEMITRHLQANLEREKKGRDCKGEEEPDICAICLDGYDGCKKMARLECGHGFHQGCIKTWLLRKNVCPMCKATALKI